MEKRSKDEALCLNCNKWVRYRIEWYDETEELGGHSVTYRAQRAFCLECGKEMVADDVDDYNLDALYAQYRKDYDLITPEEVKSIVERYDVSPEDLSALYGWMDDTIAWLLKGGILPRKFTERLRLLLEDEVFYRMLLEDNKDKISPEAYERSKATLSDDISPDEFVDRVGLFFKATPDELPDVRREFAARYGIVKKED